MRGALVLLLLAGCRQVFGLDSPQLADAPADSLSRVTGSLALQYLVSDSLGAPQVMEQQFDPNVVMIHVTQDGTTTPVDLGADGSFAFDRTSSQYSIEVRTPVRVTTYQLAADHLDLVERLLSRLDTIAPSNGTQVKIQFSNRPSSVAEYVGSTGVYSAAPMTSIVVDWTNQGWLGLPGLLDASKHDRIYYVGYKAQDATTFLISHAASAEITTAPGATTNVSLDVSAVPPTKCIKYTAQAGTETARLLGVLRPGYGTPILDVLVRATPAFEMLGGLSVVSDATGATPMDVTKTVNYGNPFPMGTDAIMNVLVPRTLGNSTVNDGSFLWVVAGADCSTTTMLSAASVALPTSFRLEGLELTDDTTYALPAAASVELGWSATPEAEDAFQVQVLDVGAAKAVAVATYVTTQMKIEIDRQLLRPGHAYAFSIAAIRGYPNAAIGDFRATAQLFAAGNTHSPVVTIQ